MSVSDKITALLNSCGMLTKVRILSLMAFIIFNNYLFFIIFYYHRFWIAWCLCFSNHLNWYYKMCLIFTIMFILYKVYLIRYLVNIILNNSRDLLLEISTNSMTPGYLSDLFVRLIAHLMTDVRLILGRQFFILRYALLESLLPTYDLPPLL